MSTVSVSPHDSPERYVLLILSYFIYEKNECQLVSVESRSNSFQNINFLYDIKKHILLRHTLHFKTYTFFKAYFMTPYRFSEGEDDKHFLP